MNDEFTTSDVVEQEFDIDSMTLDAKIADLHQEGNWIIGVTDKGVRFSQRIKQGKRLNKIGGKFVIEDVVVA